MFFLLIYGRKKKLNKIPEEKVCSAVWGKGKHIEKKNTVYPN